MIHNVGAPKPFKRQLRPNSAENKKGFSRKKAISYEQLEADQASGKRDDSRANELARGKKD